MKKCLLSMLLLSGCTTASWVVPQPTFTTKDPADALNRIASAVQAHCGGLKIVNEESNVVIGSWAAGKHAGGIVLTQCIVTLLNGDEQVRDVRVTFAVRHCPEGDIPADLDALAQSCERNNTVPEALYKELQLVAERIQAAVATR